MDESAAWEAEAASWIDRIRSPDGPMHAHDEVVRALLPPPEGLTLDVGCGEGRWTRTLASLGYDVVGVDRSERLLDEARRAHPDGRYEHGLATELPFADGAARLALCINVLPHVVELDGAVTELARVLETGGVLVVGLMHPVAQAGTFDDDTGELTLRDYFAAGEHAVPLGEHHVFHQQRTIEQYLRAFLAAGFVLDDLREVPGRTGAIPRYLDLRFTRR